jgi:hypothetical protein
MLAIAAKGRIMRTWRGRPHERKSIGMWNRPRLPLLVAVVVAASHAASAQPAPPPNPELNQAGGSAPPAPPGPIIEAGVETEFVSATAMPWEVMVDQQSMCTTPCRLMLERPHWITMRTREERPLRLEVGQLGGAPTSVTAHDLGTGMYATGITFTTLGGMALVTGITLTAVGCSSDRRGMCTAGLITGGAGVATTLGGIWLMRQALPRVKIRALEERGMALYTTGRGGGVVGRF